MCPNSVFEFPANSRSLTVFQTCAAAVFKKWLAPSSVAIVIRHKVDAENNFVATLLFKDLNVLELPPHREAPPASQDRSTKSVSNCAASIFQQSHLLPHQLLRLCAIPVLHLDALTKADIGARASVVTVVTIITHIWGEATTLVAKYEVHH